MSERTCVVYLAFSFVFLQIIATVANSGCFEPDYVHKSDVSQSHRQFWYLIAGEACSVGLRMLPNIARQQLN